MKLWPIDPSSNGWTPYTRRKDANPRKGIETRIPERHLQQLHRQVGRTLILVRGLKLYDSLSAHGTSSKFSGRKDANPRKGIETDFTFPRSVQLDFEVGRTLILVRGLKLHFGFFGVSPGFTLKSRKDANPRKGIETWENQSQTPLALLRADRRKDANPRKGIETLEPGPRRSVGPACLLSEGR